MADDADDEDSRKYAPLGRYLANLPPSQAGVRLSFDDIETIIDAKLRNRPV